ncbi:hypothetical protein Tco_1215255 [Tanacetum coccineum]
MAAFKVLETQFQMFIKSRRSIGERTQHKTEYESRVNERQIQTTEEKTDTSNALDALDASSVIIENNGTDSKGRIQAADQGMMHMVGMTLKHTEQPEFCNEGKVDQNAQQCHDKRSLPAKLTDNQRQLNSQINHSSLKMFVSKRSLPRQQSQFLKEKGNEAKVKNDIDVIETINIELEHNSKKGFALQLLKNELRYSLKYRYIVQSYRGRTQSLVAKKKDISENRASRNFDLMITPRSSMFKRRLIAADQASVFMAMTYDITILELRNSRPRAYEQSVFQKLFLSKTRKYI